MARPRLAFGLDLVLIWLGLAWAGFGLSLAGFRLDLVGFRLDFGWIRLDFRWIWLGFGLDLAWILNFRLLLLGFLFILASQRLS